MRFRELLEYKRDITANNYTNKLLPRLKDDKSFIRWLETKISQPMDNEYKTPENWMNNWLKENSTTAIDMALQAIEDVDPSPNKQYVQWLVLRYLDDSFRLFEDVLTYDTLNKFHELKVHKALPAELADINRFKGVGLNKLSLEVDKAYRKLQEKKGTEIAMPKGNATEILNNSEFRIIIPYDKDAACYYGQGTRWCTAAKNNNMFDHYAGDGPLFIVIPKDPEYEGQKWQLHFCSNQFMDEADQPRALYNMDLEDYGKLFAKYDNCAKYHLSFFVFDDIKAVVTRIIEYINEYKDEIIKHRPEAKHVVENALTWDITTLTSEALDELYELSTHDESVPYTITEIPSMVADILDDNPEKILWSFIYDNIDVRVDDDFNVTTETLSSGPR